MPRLSLYRPNRTNDYRFFDRTISEMYTVGGLDIYIHKYLGPKIGQADSALSGNYDATQPNYSSENPLFIQDLLLLENRDRAYDENIYQLRGVYNTQDIDFDLTQFGLFLANDTLFITFHYNDMIDTVGRKLMSGDVLEIPNLRDLHPLDPAIPKALPRYYVVQDAAFASEGFSQTWQPHLWRVKATPLVDSQEYQSILDKPLVSEQIWDPGNFYPAGSVVNYGDVYYRARIDAPSGTEITNTTYWEEYEPPSVQDNSGTRNKDLEINDALILQAQLEVPLSGYDTVSFYILPTNLDGTPGNPAGTTADGFAGALSTGLQLKYTTGTVTKNGETPFEAAIGIQFPPNPQAGDYALRIDYFPSLLYLYDGTDWLLQTLQDTDTISYTALGSINDYSLDPVFVTEDWTLGTVTINGNDIEAHVGIAFPNNPLPDDYSYRLDYFPNRLYKFDGTDWILQSLTESDTVTYTLADTDVTTRYTIGTVTLTGQPAISAAIGVEFPPSPSSGDYAFRLDFFPSRLYRFDGTDWVRQTIEDSQTVTIAAAGVPTITVDSTYINASEATVTPRSDGWTMGYLTGDGVAPNGLPVTPGVSFPANPREGQYCLRLDYFPNRLFRFNGRGWIKIEDNVRTDLTNGPLNNTLRSSFVNNDYTVRTSDQGDIPSRQSLSDLLRPRADNGNQSGSLTPNPRPGTAPGQRNQPLVD